MAFTDDVDDEEDTSQGSSKPCVLQKKETYQKTGTTCATGLNKDRGKTRSEDDESESDIDMETCAAEDVLVAGMCMTDSKVHLLSAENFYTTVSYVHIHIT